MEKLIFMRANHSPYVKMVKSKNPAKSLRIFKSAQSHGGYMVGVIETDAPSVIEGKWIKRYEDKHLQGSFYLIADHDVITFVSMYNESTAKLVNEIERVMSNRNLSALDVLSSIKKTYRDIEQSIYVPQVALFIKTLSGRRMTSGQILKEINEAGLDISKRHLGTCLAELGHVSKMKSVNGLNARLYIFE